MTSLISEIVAVSRSVNDNRDHRDVLTTVVEEVGELATEIAIKSGHKNREPSPDGIIGESIDVIIAAVDMIYLSFPELHDDEIEAEIMVRLPKKLKKWIMNKTSIEIKNWDHDNTSTV